MEEPRQGNTRITEARQSLHHSASSSPLPHHRQPPLPRCRVLFQPLQKRIESRRLSLEAPKVAALRRLQPPIVMEVEAKRGSISLLIDVASAGNDTPRPCP